MAFVKQKPHERANKNLYVRNDVMTTVIKCCRHEKKKEKSMDSERS